MRPKHHFSRAAVLASLTVATLPAQAGRTYTDADYSRAASMLTANTTQLVDHAVLGAYPLSNDRFWYVDTDHGIGTPMIADALHGTKKPAYDPVRMAVALHAGGLGEADPKNITLDNLDLVDGDTAAVLTVATAVYRCSLGQQYTCTVLRQPFRSVTRKGGKATTLAVLSPDGKRAVFIRDWNLWIRDLSSRAERQLTTDGVKDFGYATDNAGWQHTARAVVLWAPDSRHIATFQQDQRRTRTLSTTTTVVGHPQVETWKYPFVGDPDVTLIERVIVDADTATTVRLQEPPDQHRSTLCDDVSCNGGWDDVQWAGDSKTFAYVSTSRDHKTEKFRIATAATGAVRDVFQETVATFFDSGYESVNWRYLWQRNQILWFSQRSNWGSLYLYSAADGKLLHAVTSGDWNVDEILYIDEKSGELLLTGMGREAGANPYFRRIYAGNLDGREVTLLSPEDADHHGAVSADGRYLVDIYSTPQIPQVAVLRESDGRVQQQLAAGEVTRLKAIGWQAPETLHVKGHDGITDVYGLLYRPAHFDPAQKYPVVDYIYPGPQGGSVLTGGGWGFLA